MSKTILVTGGARSGKSRFAEGLCDPFPAVRGYLATGLRSDTEMVQRIERHQERRGGEWKTVEEPLDLLGALTRSDGEFSVLLVDCLTLWISNLLFHLPGAPQVLDRVRELGDALSGFRTPIIMVTNEVGMGIVPEHPLSRSFRDLAGEANELIAARADEVYVTISGLPLKLKG